jgi:rhodanese-related sulfurtransferase
MFGLKKKPRTTTARECFEAGTSSFLLDVREPHEYNAGHAPSAVNVPLGELDSVLAHVPRDKTVICVCRTGRRSNEATDRLRQAKVRALNLEGGMAAWLAAALPIVSETGEMPRIL